MTWDLVLVTATLVTVLLLIILLTLISRIWEDRTPRSAAEGKKSLAALPPRPVKREKVGEQETSLA